MIQNLPQKPAYIVPPKTDAVPRRPRMPRPAPASAAERKYRIALQQMVDIYAKMALATIIPVYEKLQAERSDGLLHHDLDPTKQITTAMLIAFRKAGNDYPLWALRKMIGENFLLTERVQFGNWNLQARSAGIGDIRRFTPRLAQKAAEYEARNVALIKSIPNGLHDDLRSVISGEFGKGTHVRDLSKILQDRFSVTRSRADLIATDQTLTLQGQLDELRQKDAGVTSYLWRTSNDSRVRGTPGGLYPRARFSHYEREGIKFYWNDPPEDGHPKEAIRCRCWPEPVFDDLDMEQAEFLPTGVREPSYGGFLGEAVAQGSLISSLLSIGVRDLTTM